MPAVVISSPTAALRYAASTCGLQFSSWWQLALLLVSFSTSRLVGSLNTWSTILHQSLHQGRHRQL